MTLDPVAMPFFLQVVDVVVIHVLDFLGITPMSKGPEESGLWRRVPPGTAKHPRHIGASNILASLAFRHSPTPSLRAESADGSAAFCRNDHWTSELCLGKSIPGLPAALRHAASDEPSLACGLPGSEIPGNCRNDLRKVGTKAAYRDGIETRNTLADLIIKGGMAE
jgi:hypothetical protein